MPSSVLSDIEVFLARYGVRPTALGLQALGDGSFVAELRKGRDPRVSTVERVQAWMLDYRRNHRPRRRKRAP